MWDNRAVLHRATGGYEGYERLLHRTTIGSAGSQLLSAGIARTASAGTTGNC